MNIYLGEHYEAYVKEQVATGQYTSAAEVMRDALRDHENKMKIDQVKKLIQEAMDDVAKGRVHEMTPEFWEELDRDIDAAIEKDLPIPRHVKY